MSIRVSLKQDLPRKDTNVTIFGTAPVCPWVRIAHRSKKLHVTPPDPVRPLMSKKLYRLVQSCKFAGSIKKGRGTPECNSVPVVNLYEELKYFKNICLDDNEYHPSNRKNKSRRVGSRDCRNVSIVAFAVCKLSMVLRREYRSRIVRGWRNASCCYKNENTSVIILTF